METRKLSYWKQSSPQTCEMEKAGGSDGFHVALCFDCWWCWKCWVESEVLCKLKQDQEDFGDEHVVLTVADSIGLTTDPMDPGSPQVFVMHFCAEKRSSSDDDRALLDEMEEGAIETRKSLRLLRLVHELVTVSAGALVYILSHTESADSTCMRAAAHKTARIADQHPLIHQDGVPCTFTLHPQQECPESNAHLIDSWLSKLRRTPRERWSSYGGFVVPLIPS